MRSLKVLNGYALRGALFAFCRDVEEFNRARVSDVEGGAGAKGELDRKLALLEQSFIELIERHVVG